MTEIPENCQELAISKGHQIAMQRAAVGMSLKELAEKSGVSVRTIQRVEAGENVKDVNIGALAKALGMNPLAVLDPDSAEVSASAESDWLEVTVIVKTSAKFFEKRRIADQLVRNLCDAIAAEKSAKDVIIDKGSTLITFEMRVRDARRLGTYFADGTFAKLGIEGVLIPDADADRKRTIKSLQLMSRAMMEPGIESGARAGEERRIARAE